MFHACFISPDEQWHKPKEPKSFVPPPSIGDVKENQRKAKILPISSDSWM